MYINTKHLQILDLIQKNPNFNSKDLVNILKLSCQHLKIYLDDIYCELTNFSNNSLKIEETIVFISNFNGSKSILRKVQHFTKQQNIFYILFSLSKYKYLKLCYISEELGLTPRTISKYKDDINGILDFYKLKIIVSNKGLSLIGSNFNLKRFSFLLNFKFIIEKDYLPSKLRNDFLKAYYIKNILTLKKDIDEFLTLIDCHHSIYLTGSLTSFYSAFKSEIVEKKIKDININQAIKYKPNYYNTRFFYKIFNFLQNSSFKELSATSLHYFFTTINNFLDNNVNLYHNSLKDLKLIEPILSKYFGKDILKWNQFTRSVNPWLHYCRLKSIFFIDDFSFINFNLTYIPNSNLMSMVKDIQKKIPTFTIFEGINLWFDLYKSKDEKRSNILVFKNLRKNLMPKIVGEIYKKHNLEINDYINFKELHKYSENFDAYNFVTVENIKIYNKNIKLKKLFFPFPNYKNLNW